MKYQLVARSGNYSAEELKSLRTAASEFGCCRSAAKRQWKDSVRSAYKSQKNRKYVEGRPGRMKTSESGLKSLDRYDWGEGVLSGEAFYKSSLWTCAASGAQWEEGFNLETDR